ncbi:uncharacterized protein TRUGW13939_11158 [Talaromyces rugulosus]|uniref:Protein kinase domain-containing protein n=1 Tax=Talaromyces rugulosus TaxID=121627 RepID=A0A7H8REN5_TALRU|nr:uncharacterized protein TRUGW13939_11158 [Talaromyces rugulosus]QKX63985.1 hypothetical protein TRUGW13939_11158 [Talaromyces rugulosus]
MMPDSTDYEAWFMQAEEVRKQAEDDTSQAVEHMREKNFETRDHACKSDAQAHLRIWEKTSGHIVPGSEDHPNSVLGEGPSGSNHDSSQSNPQTFRADQYRPHIYGFCTQSCLLGLQQGGILDIHCPNVKFHQHEDQGNQHPISAQDLVQILEQQLGEDLDQGVTPMGGCGSYAAPFKVTCIAYGYTVFAKGTTSRRWKRVSREAVIYRILQRLQGSAVPVFLGKINLAMTYFLHGAGAIRHMLLMGWGGENIENVQCDRTVQGAVSQAKEEILSLGVLHQDLRSAHILWNTELQKALIIDFRRCKLDPLPRHMRPQPPKRQPHELELPLTKRLRNA